MKKCIIGSISFLALSFSAYAAPVFLYPNCNYGPSYGECTLNNTSQETVSCNIQARGQTRKGAILSAYQYTVLYPNMLSWTRVSANDPVNDPIVYLNATAFCNTL
jgi:hypothetical protein